MKTEKKAKSIIKNIDIKLFIKTLKSFFESDNDN